MNCRTQQPVGLKKNLNKYTHSDIPQLHEEIAESYSDLLGPLPLKLPPFHEVSHEIPLINESKQLKPRLPKCPEVFCSELAQKIKRYTTAGWWVPVGDPSKRRLYSSLTGLLLSLFSLTAFSFRKPKNKRKAE